MGRPKKSEQGPVSTSGRILQKAMELFAEKGYNAVSVREITRSLNLNEATLYIHYKNKASLFAAIFERWKNKLISPEFELPPVEVFQKQGDLNIGENLIMGAKRFFSKADRETQLTWRILLNGQYHLKSAKQGVEDHILEAPVVFFTTLLQRYQEVGKLPDHLDTESAGRIIAAVFFNFSFRANLNAAWHKRNTGITKKLNRDLQLLGDMIGNISDQGNEP